jgi:hypothetical protein
MTVTPNNDPVQLGFEFPPNPISKEDQLDVIDRLIVLRDDPRAEFLPFTYREAWQATNMLSYINRPAGIAHQLQEVFLHNKKLDKERDDGVDTASRGLISLVFEFGDYATDSKHQRSVLYEFDTLLREEYPNPAPTLAEEFAGGHPGIAPLIRFLDVLGLRDKKISSQIYGYDIMHTVEERDETVDETDVEAKHKTIYDPYTAPNISEEVEQRIQQAMEELTIGDIRTLVVDAIGNESKRIDFWKARLIEAKRHGVARKISSMVLAELS